jgi:hypothetical protein
LNPGFPGRDDLAVGLDEDLISLVVTNLWVRADDILEVGRDKAITPKRIVQNARRG